MKSFIPSPHSRKCTCLCRACCSCPCHGKQGRGTHLDLMRRSSAVKKDKRSATVEEAAAASTSAAARGRCVHTHVRSLALSSSLGEKGTYRLQTTGADPGVRFFVCPTGAASRDGNVGERRMRRRRTKSKQSCKIRQISFIHRAIPESIDPTRQRVRYVYVTHSPHPSEAASPTPGSAASCPCTSCSGTTPARPAATAPSSPPAAPSSARRASGWPSSTS